MYRNCQFRMLIFGLLIRKKAHMIFQLKKQILLFLLTTTVASYSNAQTTVFTEDFESFSIGEDVTNYEYELLKNNNYLGTVSSLISDESGNKNIELLANLNGQASMRLRKTISVTPGKTYTYEVYTKGNFKRRLEILNASNNTNIVTGIDFTPTESEKTQWIKQTLNFTPQPGITSVKLGVFHNWSGSLKVDNYHVFINETNAKYYMSNSTGNDANQGTIEAPWKTISKLNNTPLNPGDSIFFKKGDRFDGHFEINYSGNVTLPIVITSYGTGDQPIITGEVGTAGGGDYQEAIYVENQDNLVFEDIEVNNERLTDRTGVSQEDAYGIYIFNSSNEVKSNFTFRNVTFKNVYATKPVLDPDSFNGLEVAAVRIESTKNTSAGQEKNIENVLMENCYFSNLQRLGVHIKHLGANTGIGNDAINCNKNLVFRNNEFHNLGGTCILPIRTYNCLIENNIFDRPGDNSDPRMPNRGSSVWTWRCFNTVIQYNQCLHIRGYLDSHGVHIDHENVDTFVQYNYMEDCEGGFVEILGGNVNAVYRFNVSVNDGWRENPNWINSNHTLWINEVVPNGTHQSDYNYIYNNTIYIDKPYATAIDMDGKNIFVYNNIFHTSNGGNIGGKQVKVENNGTPLFMKNNLYDGTIKSSFKNMDTQPVTGASGFLNPTNGNKFGFQIKASSAAVNSGVAQQGPPLPGAGTGIFAHIPTYPNVDYYGHPINLSSGTPNIGACNAKNGEDVTLSVGNSFRKITKIKWTIVDNQLLILNNNKLICMSIYDVTGKLLIQTKAVNSIPIESLQKGIYILKIKNKPAIQFSKH